MCAGALTMERSVVNAKAKKILSRMEKARVSFTDFFVFPPRFRYKYRIKYGERLTMRLSWGWR